MKVFGEVGRDTFIILTAGDSYDELDVFTSKMNELDSVGYKSGGIKYVDVYNDGYKVIGVERCVVFEKVERDLGVKSGLLSRFDSFRDSVVKAICELDTVDRGDLDAGTSQKLANVSSELKRGLVQFSL